MALSGLTSRAASGIDQRAVQDVLEGNFLLEHRPLSRSIRVYISSEFADFRWEKQYLWEKIIPGLRQFCQSVGLQFHVVDLYRALPVALPRDDDSSLYVLELQGALQLAMKEIKLCQRVSAGPTLVSFLAQRYGHKQLHLWIPEEEFRLISAAVDNPSAKQIIQEWYKLDTNAQPPGYVLQPCNKLETQQAVEEWVCVHSSLSKAVRKAAKVALGKDVSKVQKYTMSAVEEEVTSGIFNLQGDPNQSCFWFKRTFTDLMEQKPASDPAVSIFTDVTPGKRGLEFDSESMKTLNHLKEARMPAKYVGLDASNIFEFQLKWQRNKGLDVAGLNPAHSGYLAELGESFDATLRSNIADAADLLEVQAGNPLYQEVLCHGVYCKDTASKFMDRPDISSKIYRYLEGSSRVPLVVHGACGSGKTSIMAEVGCHVRERAAAPRKKKMIVVARFLGTTPGSSSIKHTLRSICEQLAHVYDEDESDIPADYKSLTSHFTLLLDKASMDKPLLVLLDGVDQLSPEDGASGMSWLPLALPAHVKIVLSTSSEIHRRCFPVLQSLLAKHQDNIVEVQPLSLLECTALLRHCLTSAGRSLTPAQEEVVLRAFKQCPLPLYLQLFLKEVLGWKSFQVPRWKHTPKPSVKEAIEELFHELEETHGCVFVSHTLAYISSAKFGLSESELLDILACDEEVMAEVNQHWGGAESTVPPLLWSQLYHDLTPGLLELRIGVGQTLVLCWSHRTLMEAARQRYLDAHEETRCLRYGLLADYFSGELAVRVQLKEAESQGREKRLQSNKSRTPSSTTPLVIATQPLLLSKEEEDELYNVRKLAELPHCLAESGRWDKLKVLLTDYAWLKAVINTTSVSDVISSVQLILPTVPLGSDSLEHDLELRLLRDALKFSSDALNKDPTHFSTELLGRLLPFLQQDEQESPVLKDLVVKALQDSQCPFFPLHPLVNIPGGPQLVTMEGHRDVVSCLATTVTTNQQGEPSLCILSSSWDKTVRSWDLASTGVLKTFDGHTGKVLSVAITSDAQYAVSSSEDTTVRHWHVPTSQCLHVMEGHLAAVNAVVTTSDGAKTVSASSDATVKVWNTDMTSSSCGKLIFTLRNHKSPVLALALLKDVYLASGGRNGIVLLTNIISGGVLKTLKGHTAAVTALALTEMDSRCYVVSGSEDCGIKVWRMESGEMMHSLHTSASGRPPGEVRSIAVGPNGKITVCHTHKVASVWDLVTGDHLFNLTGHTGVVCSVSMADQGGLAITGAADNAIKIWDLQSPPVSHKTRLHTSDIRSVAISPCGSYGVSSGDDAVLKIFELDTLSTIRELRGHSGAINQIFILRDSQKLLTASSDNTVRLWDGKSTDTLQYFEGHEKEVNCVALSIDGKLLMSGGEDCKVIFWNLKTGENLKIFSNHKAAVVSVAFAQNASSYYMISASRDGIVYVRDFYTAQILLPASTHTDQQLLCLDASPNALFMATGSTDKSAHIVDLPSGRLNTVLIGHKRPVTAIKILSGCKKCLTASEDCTLRMWDVTNGECLASFHTDMPVLSCDITRSLTIVYGMRKGWVSAACYDPHIDGEIPHPFLKKLHGIQSPSASSSTETKSSFSTQQEIAITSDQQNTEINAVDYDAADVKSTQSNGDGLPTSTAELDTHENTPINHESHDGSEVVPPPIEVEVNIVTPNDISGTASNLKSQLAVTSSNGYIAQHTDGSTSAQNGKQIPSNRNWEEHDNSNEVNVNISPDELHSNEIGSETPKLQKSATCSLF